METDAVSSASCNSSTSILHKFVLKSERKLLLRDAFSIYAKGHENPTEHFYQRKYNEDGEISVFDADKYFSKGREEATAENGKQLQVEEERGDLLQRKASTKSAIPSICSLEPSGDGRSTSLQKSPKAFPIASKRFFLGSFCCSRSLCLGEKSVDVVETSTSTINCRRKATRSIQDEEKEEEEEKKPESKLREDLNEGLNVGRQFMREEKKTCTSAGEVFGLGFTLNEKNINVGPSLLQNGLTMLTLDANTDDRLSESSSDLFEIDDLS